MRGGLPSACSFGLRGRSRTITCTPLLEAMTLLSAEGTVWQQDCLNPLTVDYFSCFKKKQKKQISACLEILLSTMEPGRGAAPAAYSCNITVRTHQVLPERHQVCQTPVPTAALVAHPLDSPHAHMGGEDTRGEPRGSQRAAEGDPRRGRQQRRRLSGSCSREQRTLLGTFSSNGGSGGSGSMEQRDSQGDLGFMEPFTLTHNPQPAAPNPIGISG